MLNLLMFSLFWGLDMKTQTFLFSMAYGNESGLVVIDMLQRSQLLVLGTPDLYGQADPYQRVPRSPKARGPDDSPCQDQVYYCCPPTFCLCQLFFDVLTGSDKYFNPFCSS